MTLILLILGGLATYRGTKLVLEDEILADFRDWWWSKWPPETSKIGYLLTCPHCLSVWIGLIMAILILFGGIIGVILVSILAFSAIASLIYDFRDR